MDNIITYLVIGIFVIALNYGYRYIESERWTYANEPSVLDLIGSILLWPVASIILLIDVVLYLKDYYSKKKN